MNKDCRKYDFGVFMLVVAIITFQLVKLGEYPGLYFDAINPDYIGIQLLFPQELQTRWQAAWPWLTQIYHGNIGMVITMIATIITGTTGVLQYHITYGMVTSLAVFLSYCILTHKRVGISRIWGGISALLLITWPALLTIIITQFYMCLFGTVCILGGTLIFLEWLDEVNNIKKISICYVLFGLAFYSYYNFLFFLPALVIGTIYVLKQKNNLSFATIFLPIIAYLWGCGLFIVGWSQIALCNSGIELTELGKIFLFLIIYLLITLLYVTFYQKWRIRKILLSCYSVGGLIWVIIVLTNIKESVQSLGVIQEQTFGERIFSVFRNYSDICTGKFAEGMIYGKSVSILNENIIQIFVMIILLTFVVEFSSKKMNIWKIPVAVICMYLCCCLAFGTRMQPQHYVPLVFITFIAIILCMKSMLSGFYQISKKCKVLELILAKRKIIFGISASVFLLLNLYNEAKIINEIRLTGGEGYWAVELTELANNAIKNKKRGKKELYVFEDWGFFAGFNYLTMNEIPYVTNIDATQLSHLYSQGFDIKICFWNEEAANEYGQLCDFVKDDSNKITLQEWMDDNGKVEFYEMSVIHLEKGYNKELDI